MPIDSIGSLAVIAAHYHLACGSNCTEGTPNSKITCGLLLAQGRNSKAENFRRRGGMSKREFRSAESYEAEHITRRMLSEFLRSKGFQNIREEHISIGKAESQTIDATFPSGERVRMRVKLCWRRRGKPSENTYSAVQLLARIQNDEWEASIAKRVEKARSNSITHFLVV